MQLTICDRCEKEIKRNEEEKTLHIFIMAKTFVFCRGCEEDFEEFMKKKKGR